jgi:hypothetical protein
MVSASFACACSILYSDYDHRFEAETVGDGGVAFVTTTNTVLKMTVASGNLFFAVGNVIMRVSENGGDATTWWTGTPSSESVVDMASNGTDTLIWSLGSSFNVKNSLFISPTTSSTSPVTLQSNASGLGNYLAATSDTAWSAAIGDPAIGYLRTASGETIALNFDAGAKAATPQPKALALDDAGVSMFITSARYVRYDLSGKLSCTSVGFTLTAAVIATGPSGSPTFLIDGAGTSGDLTRYDTDCPTTTSPSTMLDSDISTIVTDASAVYWCNSSGKIFRAGFTENAGTLIGTTVAEPTALAVGDSYLYAAVDRSIYRFKKSP